MIETVKNIITNVLKAIYQPFFFALVLSVFVMFFVMLLDKYKDGTFKDKVLAALKEWKNRFLKTAKFRRMFYLVFFVVMLLFKTMLNREVWMSPLRNVIGVWGFTDTDGNYTTEIIENTILFIPLIFFLFFFLETTSKRTSKFLAVMGRAIAISFLFSFSIELVQLLFRMGTFQLSDLCFNTLGGVIGGLIYWITAKIRRV